MPTIEDNVNAHLAAYQVNRDSLIAYERSLRHGKEKKKKKKKLFNSSLAFEIDELMSIAGYRQRISRTPFVFSKKSRNNR